MASLPGKSRGVNAYIFYNVYIKILSETYSPITLKFNQSVEYKYHSISIRCERFMQSGYWSDRGLVDCRAAAAIA